MRLTAKLLLAIALIITGLMSLNAATRVRRERALFLADTARDQWVLAHVLRATLKEVVARDGAARVAQTLRAAEGGAPDVHLRLTTLDRTTLPLRPSERDALRAGREVSRTEGFALTTWAPLRAADGEVQVVEVSESAAQASAYVRKTVRRSVQVAVLNVALVGAVVALLGWWLIGRPTRALVRKARRVGAGELDEPLRLPQRDELGELAREMNAMCEQLADARRMAASESEARVVALEQLRHADRLCSVGQIASSLAHELGTPLNVVLGRAELLCEGGAPAPEVVEHGRIIAAQSRRMAALIQQLLNFSRRPKSQRIRTDLRRTIEEAVGLLSPLAHRHGVRLSVVVPDEAVSAEVDPAQMQQVLTNLVVNAVQGSLRGQGVRVRLGLHEGETREGRHKAPGPYATVTVEDEGRGIPSEHLGRIFEPYFTTKEEGQGTGLGLPVAWGIAREHGGWIEVESEAGRGSRFTVFLPVVQEAQAWAEERP